MGQAGARPAVWMILVTALLDLMAMGLVMPVLPGLIEDLTGSLAAAGIWTGAIASLWAVAQFFAAPVIGALSDRFGRRPVILVSTAGLAIDWVIMALAPSLWWLVLGRVIGGVTSASGTAVFAYMADITRPEERTRAFGLVGAAISAGFVAGPALGGVLGELGPRVPFWVAAGLSGLAWLYGLVVLKESLPAERRTPFAWRSASPLGALRLFAGRSGLRGLGTGFFLLTFAHRIFTSVFVLYAGHRHGLGTLEIGLLLAGSGVLDLVVQGLLVGPAAQRFGDRAVMVFGLLGGAGSLLLMGLAPSALLFALAILPNSLWGLAEPTIKSLMSGRVAEDEQGRLQGASQSLASLAGILGPVFFGWVYGLSLDGAPWLVFAIGAAVLLLAALATFRVRSNIRSGPDQQSACPG
jgi:DHA1 family tetracycline resistance protein-like MFS transporter